VTLDPLAHGAWRGLVDSFRPPHGYGIAGAVGTTFSLSLDALVAALLGMLDLDSESIGEDPLGAVVAATRLSGKLRVLLDAGNVTGSSQRVPAHLAALLERILIPIRLEGRVFHPKVWVLHFMPLDRQAGQPDCIRVLVGSRNLSSSHALELGVVLEGHAQVGPTSALAEDVAAGLRDWAALSTEPLGGVLGRVCDVLRKTTFEEVRQGGVMARCLFQGTGSTKLSGTLPTRCERALVVSPFLGEPLLTALFERSTQLRIVSTAAAFRKLPAQMLERLARDAEKLYVIHEPEQGEASGPFEGLHAKLLLMDNGEGHAPVTFIGSANATAAGWGIRTEGNVEAMVRLEPGLSINAFTRDFLLDKTNAPKGWVREFSVDDVVPQSEDELARDELQWGVRGLAGLPWRIEYDVEEQQMILFCPVDAFATHVAGLPEGAILSVRPLGVVAAKEAMYSGEESTVWPLTFGPVALSAVSRFLVIQGRLSTGITVTRIALADLAMTDTLREQRDDAARKCLLEHENPNRILAALVGGRFGRTAGGGENGTTRETADRQRASLPAAGITLERLLRAVASNPGLVGEIRQLLSGHLDSSLDALMRNLEAASSDVPSMRR